MAKKNYKQQGENYVPEVKKPFVTTYDCPIPEELKIKNYNIIIDSDPVDNRVYLELGYDGRDEYSSAFYLTSSQAAELGKQLMEYGIHALCEHSDYTTGEMQCNMLRNLVKSKMVEEIEIKPIKLFTMDVDDSLFGRMIVDISYRSTIYDTPKSFTVLSQPIDTDNVSYIEDLKKYLEEHNVSVIKIDDLQYDFLRGSICTLRKKWLKAHKGKNPNQKEFMKPREDLAELARATMEQIKQNGKPN